VRRVWADLAESPPEDGLTTLTSLAMYSIIIGDWAGAERAISTMVEASAVLPPVARLAALETSAHLLAVAGVRTRALALLGQADQIRRGLGWGDIAGQRVRTMGTIRRLSGEWDQALADIRSDSVALAEAGLRENLALLRNAQLDILLEQGRYGEAAPILAVAPPDCPLQTGLRAVLAARLALAKGSRGTAARLLQESLAAPPEVVHRALAMQVMLHRSGGEHDAARAASARLDEVASTGTPRARLTADLCAAGALREQARAGAALETARADGLRFEEAQARFVLGVLGDTAQLPRAHAVFAELNAVPWRERAAHRLREAGLAPLPATTLTPGERRVAHLVATGLNNPQIAEELHYSRKTVEVYLTRVYAKTGLHSRVELALAVERHEV
jgi:DNA-binding NarL/FixJ family response regulator